MSYNTISVRLSSSLRAEHKSLKLNADSAKLKLIARAIKVFKQADVSQLNHTVSAEDLEFRKALFPRYRFWMRDVKVAGKQGVLTYQEVIDLSTFARAIAVMQIGELRQAFPAQPEVIEVVQCDENGRPLVEVLEEKLAYERSKREEVSAINCVIAQENSKLKAEQSKLKHQLKVKNQQIKVLKSAMHTMVNLEQTLSV